jgi:hypothetical protein
VTNRPQDRWLSAATFFVKGAPKVRGIVNLRPRLAAFDVGPTQGATPVRVTTSDSHLA